jgi:hypothetical protein
VRPGDNLWELSARYLRADVGWQRLQLHNDVGNPRRLVPGSELRFPVSWLRVEPAKAQVVAVHGDVRARTSARGRVQSASTGLRLGIGGWLETGAQASATLEFADGSRLLVQGNSHVVFDKLSAYGPTGMVDTRLHLQRGRASNRVTPAKGPASRYIIDTPSATTSVRGTRFRVSAGSGNTPDTAEVLEGRVHVDSGHDDVLLRPGYGTLAGAGSSPDAAIALLQAPAFDDARTRLHSLPVTLAWAPLDGAAAYQVEVMQDEAQDVLLFETTTEATQLRIADLPGGQHRLLLRAVADNGLQGQDATRTFILNDDPQPPLTVSPRKDEAVHQPRPRFEWTRSEGATSTMFQLATDADFDTPLIDTVVDRVRYRVDEPLAPGTYYWRVASRDAQGRQGPFGQPLPLQVSDAPPDSGLETEAERGKVTLRWQEGEPGQRYRIQVARKPDFARTILDQVLDAPQVVLDRPLGGRWYVRVQTIDDDGYEAPFGPVQETRFPCRLCYGAGATALLLLLAL